MPAFHRSGDCCTEAKGVHCTNAWLLPKEIEGRKSGLFLAWFASCGSRPSCCCSGLHIILRGNGRWVSFKHLCLPLEIGFGKQFLMTEFSWLMWSCLSRTVPGCRQGVVMAQVRLLLLSSFPFQFQFVEFLAFGTAQTLFEQTLFALIDHVHAYAR